MENGETLQLGFPAPTGSEGAQVPVEFQVFPYGIVEIEGADPFVVDNGAMDAVVEHFNARGLDMVIDYEHQTEEGSEAPAAGWIKRLENRAEEGLWAEVEWNERAREFLVRKEYRYFSPVFLLSGEERKLEELLRVALTNAPRLNWIRPIVAKIPSAAEHCGEAASNGNPVPAAEADARPAKGNDFYVCKDVLDALGLPAGTEKSEVVASVLALRQKPDLSVQVAALRQKLAFRERDDLVLAALKSGKITPAQRAWAEKYALADAEGFKLFIAKAPQVVPLGAIAAVFEEDRCLAPDADQAHINRLLGVSEAGWKKYNPQS
ncbi:MAG: phage protease [Desulfobacteraceae bacterium]|nr:phage protease [Desulfobacteraceae bacterium]